MKNEKLEKLKQDPAWRAVLTIFARFPDDPRIWNHVHLDDGRIGFKAILQDSSFGGGELRLIKIAASLFNQNYEVNLHSALGGLDENNAAAAVEAMRTFTIFPTRQ